MKGVTSLGPTHVVTAGEAAYTTLVAHFDQTHRGASWLNSMIPESRDPWPMVLTYVYAEIFRGGVPVHGVPIAFYSMTSPTNALNLSDRVQGYLGRATWSGRVYTPYGFGMILRLGAVAADDLISMGAVYEPL
jgi:hypothetical protein